MKKRNVKNILVLMLNLSIKRFLIGLLVIKYNILSKVFTRIFYCAENFKVIRFFKKKTAT